MPFRPPIGLDSLAGFDEGTLERRTGADRIWGTKYVALAGDALVFSEYKLSTGDAEAIRARGERTTYDDIKGNRRREPDGQTSITPGSGMLRGFIELANASDVEIREYARRWGPLVLCAHGLPIGHHPFTVLTEPAVPSCSPLGWGGHSWWEPIERWRALSRGASAILRLAAELHARRPGTDEDWRTLFGSKPRPASDLLDRIFASADFARRMSYLAWEVQNWLVMGQVIVRIHAVRGRTVLRIGGRSLFGALAYSIALAVSKARGQTICSYCDRLFTPSRRPSGPKRSCCPDCKKSRPDIRAAERDYRDRKRRALELLTRGTPPAEVDILVGARRGSSAKWLRSARARRPASYRRRAAR
jgi:hypothetical protein